ncbi:MAG: hypothetical protein R6U26_00090 [Candidatus Undinarchaeales archaeon]
MGDDKYITREEFEELTKKYVTKGEFDEFSKIITEVIDSIDSVFGEITSMVKRPSQRFGEKRNHIRDSLKNLRKLYKKHRKK